jgi:hypothetical protein
MVNNTINSEERIFDFASTFDCTVSYSSRFQKALASKRISAENFDRDHLFSNLAKNKTSLYFDYPKPYTELIDTDNPAQQIIQFLIELDEDFKYKIERELGRDPVRLTISELIQRWLRDDEILRVTNIHTRKTRIPEILDPDAMCPFNLLNNGNPDVERLEMMTLMVSTTGGITESHSDDADVNNHCIAGKKLWLFWDTVEGVTSGLEDNERQMVYSKPKFDMATFLGLESAGWCLVEEGDTLFLPGNHTHKVLTLEKYIGVGGFFVTYPSLLQAFTRWITRRDYYHNKEPLYRERNGTDTADVIEASLLLSAEKTWSVVMKNEEQKKEWGVHFVPLALKKWAASIKPKDRNQLEENPIFRLLFENLHMIK